MTTDLCGEDVIVSLTSPQIIKVSIIQTSNFLKSNIFGYNNFLFLHLLNGILICYRV